MTFLEALLVVIVTVSQSHDFLKCYLGKKTCAQSDGVKVRVILLSTSIYLIKLGNAFNSFLRARGEIC